MGIVSSARASLPHDQETLASVDPLAASRGIYAFTPVAYPSDDWARQRFDAIRLRDPAARLAAPSPEAIYVFFRASEQLTDHELQILIADGELIIDLKKRGVVAELPSDEAMATLMNDQELARAISALGLGSGKLQNLEGLVPEVATLMANVLLLMQARALEFIMALRRLFGFDKKKDLGSGDPFGAGPGVIEVRIEPYVTVDPEKGGNAGTRRVIRSVFKILVGCCLGLLIWAFVRNL